MKKINSLNELSLHEKKKVLFAAHSMGIFFCFFGLGLLYSMDFYPFIEHKGFFFWAECLLSLNPPILLFAFGFVLSDAIQLAMLGYIRNAKLHDFASSRNLGSTNHEISFSQSSSFSSPLSINPASGLPMCGSSGIDTRGNPLGTSSWR